jgi:hypothetical protein
MTKRPCIENRTFDEISIGDEASLSRTLAWRDIEVFAAIRASRRNSSSCQE